MRKSLLIFLMTAVLILSLSGVVAAADDISVYVDGNKLVFDVQPTIENDRTLVPLRAIFEALDAEVSWFAETRTVVATRAGTEIALKIGDKTAYINSNPTTLDVPAKIVNDRTLVPLRFVSEALGAKVKWDGNTRTITITSAGSNDGKSMTAHFIDVGQGDSILIETPNGKTILVDGGPRTAGEKVVSYLKKAGIISIDIVVATHPHENHIGGLIDVLESITVSKVYDSGYPHTSKTFEDYLSLIDQKNIKFETAHAFKSIPIDPAISVEILHPGTTMEDINNNSIVLKVQYGDVSFLLTGDAEKDAESYIMDRSDATLLQSTVLKVGHHGSTTSTSQQFLNKVAPEVAIISVGADNDYGHPAAETLQRIKAAGAEVYRTDLIGSIVISTDGETITTRLSPNKAASIKPTLKINGIDLEAETVTIENTGFTAVDMTDWKLVSEVGSQSFVFPSYTLQPGAKVIITSGRGAKDAPPEYLKWSGYIWNNEGDSGILYDNSGNVVSRY